ncbi:membrane protein [Planctomycetota bacterium]|nr:membrane protein [Planctomycetota bacterium]
MHFLLHDLAAAVIAATLAGLAAHLLRQPVILGYLVAGAAVGPLGLNLVHDQQSIETLSELGLILLLFVIGLEMDLRALAGSGRQLLVAGFGQFPLSVALGCAGFAALGYGLVAPSAEGLYLALACSLSSTAIVVKLLADRVELDTSPGRITVGVLVVQDLFAILVLAFQPSLGHPAPGPIAWALFGGTVLVAGGWLATRFVVGPLFGSIHRSPELVVATAIGWCALGAAAAHGLGLSTAMGALVAGLALASSPYRLHVTAKTLPLRDFFLTLFFVSLGLRIPAPTVALAIPVTLATAFTVLSRFATIAPFLIATGAGRRTAFIASLNLAQVSEFSLVIVALGVHHQHIGADLEGVVVYALAVTALLSSYAIRWSHPLWLACDWTCGAIGLGRAHREHREEATCDRHAIAVLGVHRTARALIDRLAQDDPELLAQVLVVDFNLEVLRELKQRGIAGAFGDLASADTLHHAHLEHARVIVLTIPDMLLKGTDTRTLVATCRGIAPHAVIIAGADTPRQAEELERRGASIVVPAHDLLGDRFAALVRERLAS